MLESYYLGKIITFVYSDLQHLEQLHY